MVGFVAAIGVPAEDFEAVSSRLCFTGREQTLLQSVGDLTVFSASHPGVVESQPATASDGTRLFVWGAPSGVFTPDGYEPRTDPPHKTPATYCAAQYDRFGTGFPDRLNGSFVGLMYEPDGTVHAFTDRLGTRPLYRWCPDDETVVLATGIQPLTALSGVEFEFDVGAVGQYFSLRRVPGARTLLADVTKLPPAAVTTRTLDGRWESRRYWEPTFEKSDESFDELVSRFSRTLRTVIDEQISPDGNYNLLLSGGFDSRLLLAELADRTTLTAYHMADWDSPEAQAAHHAASLEGVPYELLESGLEVYEEQLRNAPALMNCYGRWDQAHCLGFEDILGADDSVLVSGLYADTLFRGYSLDRQTISLPFSITVGLPMQKRISTLRGFIDALAAESPGYFDGPAPRETLTAGISQRENGQIDWQGSSYRSLRELVSYNELYPLSNDDDLFYYSLLQIAPTFTPFMDARLIDLALRIPVRKQLTDDVIAGALRANHPALAGIPRQPTNVRATDTFPTNYLRRYGTALIRMLGLGRTDSPPEEWQSQGPWPDHKTLIRRQPFILETLFDHRETIDALPFLDWDKVLDCYTRHLEGANNTWELYALVTFLGMPLVEDMVERTEDASLAPETPPVGRAERSGSGTGPGAGESGER